MKSFHRTSPKLGRLSHKRAAIGLASVLLIFLTATNLILNNYERRDQIRQFKEHTVFELEEAAAFMVEPLLKYEFSEIHQFIQRWPENHPDVISLDAITPSGNLLSNFSRQSSSPFRFTFVKEIDFAGRHLLTLSTVKDYSEIELAISRIRTRQIFASLLVVSSLGLMIWIVFRRLAIRPLEEEIAKRRLVEKELAETNSHLDQKVKDRTAELARTNEDLRDEIQERRLAENLLASEKERLSVTLRSIGDGVITTDINGLVVLMNKVAEKLTGWCQEDALGRPLSEVFRIISEKTREPAENPVEKVLETGQIIGLANHTALIARDGSERSIADSGAPVRDRNSTIIGVVLVFRDVTDQLRTEREWSKIRKLESVGVLAGGIAHDFNNYLTAILGNVSLALLDPNITSRTRNSLGDVRKASLRAKDLTQQILTFAKGGEPIKKTTSFAEIIKDSAGFVLSGNKVACQYRIAQDLWLVEVDEGQISQVVQNLVLNASQAMPEGGIITATCENVLSAEEPPLSSAQYAKYVKLRIQDSGIGIPYDMIDKIFDPYFSTKQKGSGLGLAISHAIIAGHDGHVFVESNPGEGTTFTVYLPASDKAAASPPQCGAYRQRPTYKARIMIMDDEKMIRNMAREMLRELGHEAVLARDGQEAVHLYGKAFGTEKSLDLVIMDLTIAGGMGGKEAVQRVLAIDPGAKVIASSGYSTDPILASYKDFGFCNAISKPYEIEELSKTIEKVLKPLAAKSGP
jgi:PAS domain S-box-containing protein